MRFLALVPAVLTLALAQVASAASGDASQAAQAASAPGTESSESAKQHVVVQGAPETPEAPKLECHMESDIGSMRMHKICTKVPTEAERLQMQDAIRQGLPNNNLTHPAVGSNH